MKRGTGILLILLLAACSRQEPPPVAKAAPAKPAPAPAAVPSVLAPQPTGLRPDPAALAAQLKQGEDIFTNTCATCHMADGNGVPNMQPGIVGSGWISAPDPQLLLSLILRGATVMGEAANAYDNKMPPLDHLTDAEVAAVATYVRQRFAGVPITVPVTPAEVAVARARPGLPK